MATEKKVTLKEKVEVLAYIIALFGGMVGMLVLFEYSKK
jgi:hypothetical protein